MALGPPGRRNDSLNVILMAVALVAAAIVGSLLGVLWHAAGFGAEDAAGAEGSES